jgi:two-component sensor histidine kinase
MTGVAAAADDPGSTFDAIKDRLRRALTMLAVQAWRSSDVQQRDELSSLADRIRIVVDHYEQRRSVGVRSVDPTDYLEWLRRKLVAAADCEQQRIRLAIASNVEELSNESALVVGLITSELVAIALARACENLPRIVTVRFGRDLSGHFLTVAAQRRRWREAIPSGPDSVGMALVRQLVRDLEGTFGTVNNGAGVEVRLPLGGNGLASPLRNISPRRTLKRPPAHTLSPKERLHELRHS